MEDDLDSFENGRQLHFQKWKATYFLGKWKATSILFENGRQPEFV
jgi:hypothetical protein